MYRHLILLILSAFILFSCGVEEDETQPDNNNTNDGNTVPDNDETLPDNELNDESNESGEITDEFAESFCYSGGAVLYEGDQQYKMCPGDFKRVLKQICRNGKWVDEGDCTLNYAVVPDGWFKMGCDIDKEGYCEEDNIPVHEPRLSEYAIDKFEVNTERFEQCIAAGACNNNNADEPHYRTSTETYSCNIGNSERKNHPANCVTWYGAKAFCEWAEMRLPTEAEWEKAARAGNVQIYPWGDSPVPDCDHAIIKTVSSGCGYGVTFPIGTTPEGISQLGLFDMGGNVSEYVSDWYQKDFYSDPSAEDRDVKGPDEPEYDKFKVCRGGSYLYDERRVRTAFRNACKLDDPAIDFDFRCAANRK
ncbi:MAG TPA: SUMF1/EgtB/PvdO family nonheme iron enzyme [bacterium]|nr:SUMF1/EgtB/PvdO family nonheme iron enzyme [bacterium]